MYDLDKIRQEFINKCGYEPTNKELLEYIKNTREINSPNANTNSSKAAGILVIVWFIASILSLLYYAKTEQPIPLMLVFGHYFLVFGILAFLANKSNNNQVNVVWPFILGLGFMTYLFIFPDGIKINMDPNMFMFFVLGSIFFVVGLSLFISTIHKTRSNNLVGVNAVICDYHRGSKGTRACVYEYEYNGQKYTVCDNYYTNIKVPQLGTIKHIKINKDNPEEIITKGETMTLLFLAIPFMLMGGLCVCLSLFVK